MNRHVDSQSVHNLPKTFRQGQFWCLLRRMEHWQVLHQFELVFLERGRYPCDKEKLSKLLQQIQYFVSGENLQLENPGLFSGFFPWLSPLWTRVRIPPQTWCLTCRFITYLGPNSSRCLAENTAWQISLLSQNWVGCRSIQCKLDVILAGLFLLGYIFQFNSIQLNSKF